MLSGKAVVAGILTIRGCFVQAPGGALREYVLPLYTTEEEERLARKKRAINSENGRSKYSGVQRYPWSKAHQQANRKSTESPNESRFHFLECKVVPEQPLLRIRRTSVTHGALMLYDGEQCVNNYLYSTPLMCRTPGQQFGWHLRMSPISQLTSCILHLKIQRLDPLKRLLLMGISLSSKLTRRNIISSTNLYFRGTSRRRNQLLRTKT